MILDLTERLLFPAGRAFVPFPVRRCLLTQLEDPAHLDLALAEVVRRAPQDTRRAPRAWLTTSGEAWLRLEAALSGAAGADTVQDWLALNGPLDSVAEQAFVTDILAPALGVHGLRALRAQEPFLLPNGRTGRIDFVLELGGTRIAIEIDGAKHHEGPGEDGSRPEREKERQNTLTAAGYAVLRYSANHVLKEPATTRKALAEQIAALGLLPAEDGGRAATQSDPLPIQSSTHELLGPWPRAFVRAQQAALDLLRESPDWLATETRTLLLPRTDRGATLLGILDALEAWCSAADLLHQPRALRRLRVWIGSDHDVTQQLLATRQLHAEAPGPFELELVADSTPPAGADVLLLSAATTDVEEDELATLTDSMHQGARIVWCSDVDAAPAPPRAARPSYFTAPQRPVVERLLDRFFGFPAFRDGQWEIVEQLLVGNSALGVLPTGAGKTVCFQLPALLQPGFAVVVSPLVSLMDDQVMNLRSAGLDFAGRDHSNLAPDEREQESRRMRSGDYKLFYVAPERFHTTSFTAWLAEMAADDRLPVSYFVVDEAHLASEWGHDFRPSYLTLPEARDSICPQAPIALLTATAPRQIRQDLAGIFGQSCDLQMILPPTFDRPELSFAVERVQNDAERIDKITSLLRETIPQSLGHIDFFDLHGVTADGDTVHHGGLVFTPWGKPGDFRPAIRAANLARTLNRLDLPADEYRSKSAGHETRNRGAINRHTQERFKRNELPLVVATKGFGTGIDKPDIRYVVHADMPGSLEALYQEAGRAGRDGQDARAVMVYRPRPLACTPDRQAPICTATGQCPHDLEELCSFGIQARLRAGNQPGATAEIETSLTLWRDHFRQALDREAVILPRDLNVRPLTREEVIDQTPEILARLHQLDLCGELKPSPDPDKPFFVRTRQFSKESVAMRVQALSRSAEKPRGISDESYITSAVHLAFGVSEREAHDHTAIWFTYLRPKQMSAKGWAAVPRPDQKQRAEQKPDVERFLARLVTLGVVRHYRYRGTDFWVATLTPAGPERSVERLSQRLAAAIDRHRSAAPTAEPLPAGWSDAVEAALERLIRSWYETIAARSWETLEHLEDFAKATDCRRRRIAGYMNESAVSITVPCGHCDNCGIAPLGDVRARTVDEQAQARVAQFNTAFEALADRPQELTAVDTVLDEARRSNLLHAVRDRAGRHLERAPFDPAPRLAAAIAAFELDEAQAANRHARTLLDTLAETAAIEPLVHSLQRLPVPLLADLLPSFERSCEDLPTEARERLLYLAEHRAAPRRAYTRAARLIRNATELLRTPPSSTPKPDHV